MPNQRAIIGSPDLYAQAARRFLQLIPASCITAERLFLDNIQQGFIPPPVRGATPPPIFTSSPLRGQSVLKHPTPTHAPQGKTLNTTASMPSLNPFDTTHDGHSCSGGDASIISGHVSSVSTTSIQQVTPVKFIQPYNRHIDEERKCVGVGKYSSTKSNRPDFQFEYISPEVAYLKNLSVARDAIFHCATCCRCWSSLYDKCIVSKESMSTELENEQPVKRSLEMEDVTIKVRVTSEGDESGDILDFGRFRSQAMTVSAQSRNLSTNSVWRHKEEGDNVIGISMPSDPDKNFSRSVSPANLRRRATTRSRASPRIAKRQLVNTFGDKIGLFMKILLEKLYDILQCPPSVNVLLTRLISRLAQFPQPLLRSLLLNHQLVLRPGVPALIHVSAASHMGQHTPWFISRVL